MMRGHIVDKINEIDDKLFFLREKINRSISDLNTRAVHEASKSIISLILRREDLMTQEDSHQEKPLRTISKTIRLKSNWHTMKVI